MKGHPNGPKVVGGYGDDTLWQLQAYEVDIHSRFDPRGSSHPLVVRSHHQTIWWIAIVDGWMGPRMRIVEYEYILDYPQ